jgi:hypothetical protein
MILSAKLRVALAWVLPLLLLSSCQTVRETANAPTQAAVARVLFVGNSITYWNYMPAWVAELGSDLRATPPVETKDVSIPDARLLDQLLDTSDSSPLGTIRKGGWSVVVVQAHPREPLQNPEEFFSAASKLAHEVRQEGAEPMFFETYPFPAGDDVYKEAWSGGSPEEMHARIREAYARLAGETGARVLPIGDAWQLVRANHPEINLYAKDERHPSANGSYLVACVIISSITGKNPRSATWLPTSGVTMVEAEAAILRDVAESVRP